MKTPPPLIAIVFLVFEWLLDRYVPIVSFQSESLRQFGMALAGVTIVLAFIAVIAFFAHRTTLNPHGKPSTMITGGIYRITRNPMYLSLTLLLIGGAVYLGSVTPFVLPIVFIALITNMFIIPEERMMTELFGEQYTQYAAKVRRWI